MCGETDAARRILTALRPDVRVTGSPAGQVNLTYARAVLASENEIETRLREAIRSDMATWPIERNRLLLTYGAWLRRRRARESRDYLREARDGFERLGARPWAERAREDYGPPASAATCQWRTRGTLCPRRRYRSPLWSSRASPTARLVSHCYLAPNGRIPPLSHVPEARYQLKVGATTTGR